MSSEGARKVTVEVPASSANLGPGFDALALALELRLRVTVEKLDNGSSELEVAGEGRGRLALNRSNRFLAGLERGLAAAASAEAGTSWRIGMHNEIPLARGLGSSAAATVAGLVAAEALGGVRLGSATVLALASEIEGHADNAAAALLGGFVVVSGGQAPGEWRAVRLDPPAELRAVVFVPQLALSTADMRAALPESVPHADAARNIGRAALIVAAMATGQLALLSAMNDDRLHEPYREQAFPQLPEILAAARAAGALGAALSGAGSSVIALCDSDLAAAAVMEALRETSGRLDLAGEARIVGIEPRGARVLDAAAG